MYDGSHVKLYKDGELVAEHRAFVNLGPSDYPLIFNKHDEEYWGDVDEVLIYDKALEPDELYRMRPA